MRTHASDRRRWALLAAAGLLLGISQVRAEQQVFDNFDSSSTSKSGRLAGESPGALISVGQQRTISRISVRNNLTSDGELKFVIFDHSDHALLYESDPLTFTGGTMDWKRSDRFKFVLQAGKSHDIGAIANQSGQWAYDVSEASQNGFIKRAR
jgi:hypothetical protein